MLVVLISVLLAIEESADGKLRDELLNRELFLSLDEARWVIDRWRLDYNHHRPHSSLEHQTPAAFAAGSTLPDFATRNPPEHSLVCKPDSLTETGTILGGGGQCPADRFK